MHDLVIRNARLYDGDGAVGKVGDLAVAWQIPSVHGAGPFLWQPLANATGMDEVGTLTNLAVLEPDEARASLEFLDDLERAATGYLTG